MISQMTSSAVPRRTRAVPIATNSFSRTNPSGPSAGRPRAGHLPHTGPVMTQRTSHLEAAGARGPQHGLTLVHNGKSVGGSHASCPQGTAAAEAHRGQGEADQAPLAAA